MQEFVITPADHLRKAITREGHVVVIQKRSEYEDVTGYYPYKYVHPILGKVYSIDEAGASVGLSSPSIRDVVGWADEPATEQPISFDSGYVQKKLGESFSKYSIPNTGTLNHVDVQTTKQVRPKDLRDEFAMSVIASIVGNQDYYEMPNPDKVKWVDRVAQYAYVFADAMKKAREEK